MRWWNMSKSDLEAQFLFQVRACGLPIPEREVRFHPKRKWRFDFAYPEKLLAIEICGGMWVKGRHNNPISIDKDYEKLNHAQVLGWVVLQFTGGQVESGEAILFLEKTLDRIDGKTKGK